MTTPKPTTVYSFAIIDLDLLRDDVSSASGVLPVHFWLTRDAAQKALIEELESRWKETVDEGTNAEESMPDVTFTENEYDEGGLSAEVGWLDEAEVYVYALTLSA